MADRIEVLQRFCAFVGREPDSVIEECSREVEGGKRIRIKKRRLYSEKIDEFQASLDGDARAQARAGDVVRSFMIHNRIFMQGGVGGLAFCLGQKATAFVAPTACPPPSPSRGGRA